MSDLRKGLYGLNIDELEQADSLGLSPWEFAVRHKGIDEDCKPLTPEQKKAEQARYFEERLAEHTPDLKIWLDGDGDLWLGWFRKTSLGPTVIIIVALLQLQQQTIVAVPMRRDSTDAVDGVAWHRPWMGQQVWEKIKSWRRIVPPGVF